MLPCYYTEPRFTINSPWKNRLPRYRLDIPALSDAEEFTNKCIQLDNLPYKQKCILNKKCKDWLYNYANDKRELKVWCAEASCVVSNIIKIIFEESPENEWECQNIPSLFTERLINACFKLSVSKIICCPDVYLRRFNLYYQDLSRKNKRIFINYLYEICCRYIKTKTFRYDESWAVDSKVILSLLRASYVRK